MTCCHATGRRSATSTALLLGTLLWLAVALTGCAPPEGGEHSARETPAVTADESHRRQTQASTADESHRRETDPREAAAHLPDRGTQRLEQDVAYLAATERQGRGLRTDGIREAERFIRARFEVLGLEEVPGFSGADRRYSAAPMRMSRSLGKARREPPTDGERFKHSFTVYRHDFDSDRSRLTLFTEERASGQHVTRTTTPILRSPLHHGDGMRAVPHSGTGESSGELSFAGYAVDAPDRGWSDFNGLGLDGRIALAFRFEPWLDEPVGPVGRMELSSHAGFARKARAAREAGAEALIVVTGSKHAREPEDMTPWDLMSLEADESPLAGLNAVEDMPVVHVSHAVGKQLFARAGYRIEDVQRALRVHGGLGERSGSPPAPPAIERIKQQGPAAVDLSQISANIKVVARDTPKPIDARNVLGFMPGENSERTIVIGAHHDHLGAFGEGKRAVYHGADDNASGVAATLELAARFAGHVRSQGSAHPRARVESPAKPPVNLLFITFSAEEVGLLGSRAFVASPESDALNIDHMINLDMLGRNPDMPVDIRSSDDSADLVRAISSLAAGVDSEVDHTAGNVRRNSDHYPFHRAGIPVFSVFTGLHEDYHDVGDTWDKLDYEQISDIVDIVEGLIYWIAAHR